MRIGIVGSLAVLALLSAGAGAPPARSHDGSPTVARAPSVAGEIVLRPPVGQGRDGRTLVPGVAAFTPASPGAAVEIQRRDDRGWTVVAAGEQNAAGEFAFRLPVVSVSGEPEYRARTELAGRKAPVVTPPSGSSPWRFVWADDFAGGSLGEDWVLLPVGAPSRPCVRATPETVQVGGGVARFSAGVDASVTPARSTRCPDGHFLNAQFGTTRVFTYGIFAARLRTQAPEGMHSAFWLHPRGAAPEGIPAEDLPGHQGVEVDVVEYFGDTFGASEKQGQPWTFVHWPRRDAEGKVRLVKVGGVQQVRDILGPANLPSADFHVYSVEWTPAEYIFRVNGVETMRIDQGISRRPEMIRLSLLTSAWETPQLTQDSLPASMDVDWVRVWQR